MAMGDGLSLDARAAISAALQYAQRDASCISTSMSLVQQLYRRLDAAGLPLLRPCGGHAVFLRAGPLLPHWKGEDHPAEALNRELFLRFGLRGSPFGDAARGTHGLRLAIPILTLDRADLDEISARLCEWLPHAQQTAPLRLAASPKTPGGFFRARFAPLASAPVGV